LSSFRRTSGLSGRKQRKQFVVTVPENIYGRSGYRPTIEAENENDHHGFGRSIGSLVRALALLRCIPER
jgi:hypothetical protein